MPITVTKVAILDSVKHLEDFIRGHEDETKTVFSRPLITEEKPRAASKDFMQSSNFKSHAEKATDCTILVFYKHSVSKTCSTNCVVSVSVELLVATVRRTEVLF